MFKNIFALIGLVTVVFLGVGWYRGWYMFDVQDKTIHIDINREKVRTDFQDGVDRSGNIIDDIRKDKGGQGGKTSVPSVNTPAPVRSTIESPETHNFFTPTKPTGGSAWKPISEIGDDLKALGLKK